MGCGVSEPETVPNWVLTEVGRLHLHALALERALAEMGREPKPEPVDPDA